MKPSKDSCLFAYRMTHDYGFAPNPFYGFLTLATCKPGIRRTKLVGQWVAGFASKALAAAASSPSYGCPAIPRDGLVYLMKVTERITLDEYFNDDRFRSKKPRQGGFPENCGDNIYQLDAQQHRLVGVGASYHSEDGKYSAETTEHDTSGRNVLISDCFYYLGRECFAHDWQTLGVNLPNGPTCYGVRSGAEALENLLGLMRDKRYSPNHVGNPCLQEPQQVRAGRGRGC